jgi:hypothetical protein
MKFAVGDKVERDIEGMTFVGTIERISGAVADIRYLDDDNVEKNIPIDELIRIDEPEEVERVLSRNKSNQSAVSLHKPLSGLIDDDEEQRRSQLPTVLIHQDNSETEAIIFHGAENRLAAGGGLRALRYLK